MQITFEKVTGLTMEEFELIAKWDNEEDIKYLVRPNFNEGEIEDTQAHELFENFKKSDDKYLYMILVDDVKVGYVSLDTQFPMLYRTIEKTGWISICIGESTYRHLGLGEKAMMFLESLGKTLQLKRLELGVFVYNLRAISFYQKMGYQEIGRIEAFVYYQGKRHADIRMEKKL